MTEVIESTRIKPLTAEEAWENVLNSIDYNIDFIIGQIDQLIDSVSKDSRTTVKIYYGDPSTFNFYKAMENPKVRNKVIENLRSRGYCIGDDVNNSKLIVNWNIELNDKVGLKEIKNIMENNMIESISEIITADEAFKKTNDTHKTNIHRIIGYINNLINDTIDNSETNTHIYYGKFNKTRYTPYIPLNNEEVRKGVENILKSKGFKIKCNTDECTLYIDWNKEN